MNLTPIETERLILRPFTLDDIEPSYLMNLDKAVSKYTGDGGVVNKAEIKRRITEDVLGDYAKHGYGRFAVELKGENPFIGFAGLKFLPDLGEVDLGYRFLSEYWGQGLATEAGKACLDFGFEKLSLEKIVAYVLPENIGSINVLDKLGFSFKHELIEDEMLVKKYSIFS